MKIQVLVKGRDKTGRVQMYRTLTEAELPDLFRLLTARDGKRPWDKEKRDS